MHGEATFIYLFQWNSWNNLAWDWYLHYFLLVLQELSPKLDFHSPLSHSSLNLPPICILTESGISGVKSQVQFRSCLLAVKPSDSLSYSADLILLVSCRFFSLPLGRFTICLNLVYQPVAEDAKNNVMEIVTENIQWKYSTIDCGSSERQNFFC